MEMDSYWLSELFQFEGDATTTTTFYLPENRKLAKKMITPASPGYNAERKGYDLRQKQVKSPVPDATEKPNVQNGATEYAPDLAPYIEFTGELRQDMTTGEVSTERFGRVTYRVYLGYTAENDPVNDYDIERNVHYTYNVTIKGMNDLVVEAMSDKDREEEPAPGVEGLDVYKRQERERGYCLSGRYPPLRGKGLCLQFHRTGKGHDQMLQGFLRL